jgi:hypothetical protein
MLGSKDKYSFSISPSLQFVFFSVMMFFIYAPIFFIRFGRMNDYTYILDDPSKLLGPPGVAYTEAAAMLIVGRPLGAALASIQAMLFNSVDSLVVGRFVSFSLCLIAAFFIYNYFIKKKLLEPVPALVAIFLIFTLPCMQLAISFFSLLVIGCLVVLLSTIAYVLLDKVTTLSPKSSDFKSNVSFLLLSFIVLSAALYIYPANVLFFLIFPLSNILFSTYKDWQKIRLTVLRDLIFFIVTIIIYYGSIKTMYLMSSGLVNQTGTGYEFSIGLFSTDFIERIAYVAHVLLETLDGFQLILLTNLGLPIAEVTGYTDAGRQHSAAWWQKAWLAEGTPSVITPKVLFLALFALGCLSKYFRHSDPEEISANSFYRSAQMTTLVVFLILLAIAPVTVPVNSHLFPPGLRNTIPISVVWVLISFWSILSIKRLIMKDKAVWMLPVALAVIVGATTMSNLITSSLNAHMELSFIRQMLSSRDLSKIDRVVLLGLRLEWAQAYTRLTSPSATLIGKGLQAEFYLLGANNSMQPMIDVALLDMGVDKKDIAARFFLVHRYQERHWIPEEDKSEYPKYIRLSNKLWDSSNMLNTTVHGDEESTLIINMNHAKLTKLEAVD